MKTIIRFVLLTILAVAYLLQLAYVKLQDGKFLFSQNYGGSSLITSLSFGLNDLEEFRYYQSVLDRTDKAEPANTTYTAILITKTKVERTVINQPTLDTIKNLIEVHNKAVDAQDSTPFNLGLTKVTLREVKVLPEWLYLALGAVVIFVPLGRKKKKI